MILPGVNAGANPFIQRDNMGKVMATQKTVPRAAALAAAGILAVTLAAAPGAWQHAAAQAGEWVGAERVQVRLVAATAAVGTAEALVFGLEFSLAPGWKTYWRSPGEGGMPPRFDWTASHNVSAVEVAWPAPERFAIGGMESLGYGGQAILPLRVAVAEPGKAIALRLVLRYAVCADVCIPEEARLSLDLPAGPARPSAHAEPIAAFAARVPRPAAALGWAVERAGFVAHASHPDRYAKLTILLHSAGAPFERPEILVESTPERRFGAPYVAVIEGGRRLRLAAPFRKEGGSAPAGEFVITVLDGERRGTFTLRLGANP